MRNYAKQYEEAEWPRAAAAVDLATIRPVAVVAPTLLGFNDVYQSVRPGMEALDDASIPVAKAIAVTPEKKEEPTASPDAAASVPTPPAPEAAAPTPPAEPEIRKAESLAPLDSPLDKPVIQLPPPALMDF